MPKKKLYKSKSKTAEANEPHAVYGSNNRIVVTTFEELEKMDIELARNRTHDERMEYLQKLIYNLYGPDLSKQEAELKKGKIKIRKFL